MERLLWGWVAGVLMLWFWPVLPDLRWAFCPLLMALLAWCRWRALGCLLLGLALGGAVSVWQAAEQMRSWLPSACEGKALTATGVIDGLPSPREDGGWRLVFRPQAAPPCVADGARWQLSWRANMPVRPGETWRLTVTLKRPHGPSNPGGFDAERFAHENRISAIGHIRQGERLQAAAPGIDAWRQQLRERLLPAFPAQPVAAGTVLALLTGDRSGIPAEAWERYARTGITHLVAISGVHITMVAWLAGLLTRRLWRLSPSLLCWQPAGRVAALAGWFAAFAYAALAGLEVPAQRTLLMLGVLVLMRWLPGEFSGRQALLAALALVLLIDPLAIHAMGLWLSFAAVALLMLGGLTPGEEGGWRAALRGQWLATWGLMPLSLLLFGRLSWLSLPVNLVAIPWVTFGVVPLAMLGALLQPLLPSAGVAVWALAVQLMAWLDAGLAHAASWPGAFSWFTLPGPSGLWLMLSVALLLMPRRLPGRWLAPLPLLAVVWPLPPLAAGQAEVTFLDVDQGLAVHVRTASHHLLYDTGPPYGPHTDAGARQILPYLRLRRVAALDRLMLSHGDNDHVGGAGSVLQGLPVRSGMGAWPDALADWPSTRRPPWQPCQAGTRWVWDGVRFEVLWPDVAHLPDKDNDRSCVLRIVTAGGSMLIPGDLEKPGEEALLAGPHRAALHADVLSLGHHGSKTSTSAAWLTAVSPRMVVASLGYRNRYRHPHPTVVARVQQAGIPGWRTDRAGAVQVLLGENGAPIRTTRWRAERVHYWQRPDAVSDGSPPGLSMLGALQALP